MIVVASCGNGFSDEAKLASVMDYLVDYHWITAVVVPQRMGHSADAFPLFEAWAKKRAMRLVGEKPTDQEFKKFGEGVSAVLHRRIIDRHKPQRLIAFPGRGDIEELMRQARAAGIKVTEVA